jgi:hypothetical protein
VDSDNSGKLAEFGMDGGKMEVVLCCLYLVFGLRLEVFTKAKDQSTKTI